MRGGQNPKQSFVLEGGRVIDPSCGRDGKFDVMVEEGLIRAIDKPGTFSSLSEIKHYNVKDLLVVPGLVDIHVHLREPGYEWKETILTGTQAAVAGGFTTVCCMPNTNPINDCAQVTEFILKQACQAGICRVYPIGAITMGSEGKSLAPFLELREAGCVAFSDDGKPVCDAGVMRKALEYVLMFDGILTVHEEEKSLSEGFSMNESALSLKLGLKGMPGASEDVMISRDIELARLTGGRVHFCHVSTARAVTLIRRAKEDGLRVTAEVAPHHFSLDESLVEGYDTSAKMSMPLRGKEDVAGVLTGLREGVLDCIASDHAPHEADSKNKEFSEATFGIIGFQTTLPLTLAQVRANKLSLVRAIEALTSAPARCLGLPVGTLEVGKPADICVIDLEKKITFTPEVFRSKSKNTPYLNKELQGNAVITFMAGKEVYVSGFEKEGGKTS